MGTEVLKEYDTTLDNKHRITVRGSGKPLYKNYHVFVYNDGRVLLEPRVLVYPEAVSKKTLTMMETAMDNYRKGIVSKPLNLKKMKARADALPD